MGMSGRDGGRSDALEIEAFQEMIERAYKAKDVRRGTPWTFAWLVEEVGELGKALREGDRDGQEEEFADVFAWLCGLANLADVSLTEAVRKKYGRGCPVCGRAPCACQEVLKGERDG